MLGCASKKQRMRYQYPWRRGHQVLYWGKAAWKGDWAHLRAPFSASMFRAFPLESVSAEAARDPKFRVRKYSGEAKELVQEDNPFPVYRPVGVYLQEETTEGDIQLPHLFFTAQTRPARLLLPISMDQKGKRGTLGGRLTCGCSARMYRMHDMNKHRQKGDPSASF